MGNNKATLDKKSISAIVDQVEMRLRQPGEPAAQETVTNRENSKSRGKSTFFWGAVSGIALAAAAPLVGKRAKPAVRGAIKGGIVAGRCVQRAASTVFEDVQDLTAEAKAELDDEEPGAGAGRK